MLGLLLAYILGGLTMLPLAVIAFLTGVVYLSPPVGDVDPDKPTKTILEEKNTTLSGSVSHQGWIVLRRTFAASELNAASYINNLVRSLRQSTPQRPPDTFYAQLKRTVLYLYDDEHCSECHAAIQLSAFNVDIFPGGQLDGELFAKRNAIRLSQIPTDDSTPKQDTKDGRSESPIDEQPYFIFIKNTSHMEDWYHSLLHASHNPTPQSDPLHPLHPVFSQQHMAHLVDTLDSQPDPIPMRWLNALIGRLFFSMYRTKFLESLLIARLMKKISKVPRPAFLKEIVVREVNVGTTVPFFSKPMLKELTAQGDAAVELGLSYYSDNPRDRPSTQNVNQSISSTTMDTTSSSDSTVPNQNILTSTGGVRIIVEATVSIDLKSSLPLNLGARFDVKPIIVKVVLAVVLRSLEGNLVVRVKRPPSNRIWYAFTSMPKMELELLPIVSDRKIKWGLILKPLENLLREVIQESVVLPYMDDIPFFDTEDYSHRGGIFADAVRTSYDFSASTASAQVPPTANINTGSDGNTEVKIPGHLPIVLGDKDKDNSPSDGKQSENEVERSSPSSDIPPPESTTVGYIPLRRAKSAEPLEDTTSTSTVPSKLDFPTDPLLERSTTIDTTASLPVPIPSDAKVPAVLVNSPPRKIGWLARFGNPSNTSVSSSLKDGSASIVNWEDKGSVQNGGERMRTISSGSTSVDDERAPSPNPVTDSSEPAKKEDSISDEPSLVVPDTDNTVVVSNSDPTTDKGEIEPPSDTRRSITPDLVVEHQKTESEPAASGITPVTPPSSTSLEPPTSPQIIPTSTTSSTADTPSVSSANGSSSTPGFSIFRDRSDSPASSNRSGSPPPSAVQTGQALLAAWKNRDRQGAQIVLESTMRKWGFGPNAKKATAPANGVEASTRKDDSTERKAGVNGDDPIAKTKSFADMRADVVERRKTPRPSSPGTGESLARDESSRSTEQSTSQGDNASNNLGPFSFLRPKSSADASNTSRVDVNLASASSDRVDIIAGRPRSDTAHSRSISVAPTLLVSSALGLNGSSAHSRRMSMGTSNQGEPTALPTPHPVFSRQPGQGATMKIPGIHASHRGDVMSLGSSPPRPSAPLSSPPTPSHPAEGNSSVIANEKVQVALQSVIRLFNKGGTSSDGGSGTAQRASDAAALSDDGSVDHDPPRADSAPPRPLQQHESPPMIGALNAKQSQASTVNKSTLLDPTSTSSTSASKSPPSGPDDLKQIASSDATKHMPEQRTQTDDVHNDAT